MRCSARSWSSQVVPYQTLSSGFASHVAGTMLVMFCGRLVRRRKSSQVHRSMSGKTTVRRIDSTSALPPSKRSPKDMQNVRRLSPAAFARSFHFTTLAAAVLVT